MRNDIIGYYIITRKHNGGMQYLSDRRFDNANWTPNIYCAYTTLDTSLLEMKQDEHMHYSEPIRSNIMKVTTNFKLLPYSRREGYYGRK